MGFYAAAEKEYRGMNRSQLVSKTEGDQASSCDVGLYKFDTDGFLVKYKARLCVRGRPSAR